MRVLVADDDADVRSALRLFLGLRPEIAIVGEANHAAQVATLSLQLEPDLVMLDWELPGWRGQAELTTLTARPVLVMSSRREAQRQALAAGAAGFICKVDPPEALLAALDRATERSLNCQHDEHQL